ncbi:hypothetical protein MCAP1_002703 [Malassezia caprae]|uniref:Uncharacterized protein n=1 Tax=Malassezia caprae TaxID=1381934 RepID=A0AAF0E8X7_9BASI|nr:hypothetical protein MCAP1_002703 [Malassezia caprae]
MASASDAGDRLAPLTTQEQGMLSRLMHADDVLKARLAADEKYVRRVAKRVAQLAKLENDKERADSTTAREIQAYDQEADILQQRCEQAQVNVSELKTELEQAQLIRSQKLEYNDIARKILVYPSPEAMDAKLEVLRERIKELKQNVEHYEQAHASAQSGLQDVDATLSALQSSVAASLNKNKEHAQESTHPAAPATEATRSTDERASVKRSYEDTQSEPSAPSKEPKRPKGAAAAESSSTAP